MIRLRPADERGVFDHGWLLARHTFSFASYHDRRHMGFRVLRVINEDTVQPRTGFGTHGHEDMEIVTWVLSGSLEHTDDTGSRGVLRPGDAQVMSAGTGIEHSEVNPSASEPLHLLQIWIRPDRRGHAPRYADRTFAREARTDRLCPIASGAPLEDALQIHQDAHVFTSLLAAGREVVHPLGEGRGAWLQLARGAIELGGERLSAGDGAAIEGERELRIAATEDAELLLFDLP